MLASAALLQSVNLAFTGLAPSKFCHSFGLETSFSVHPSNPPQQQQPNVSCIIYSSWDGAELMREPLHCPL
jgi:hypothetical protein